MSSEIEKVGKNHVPTCPGPVTYTSNYGHGSIDNTVITLNYQVQIMYVEFQYIYIFLCNSQIMQAVLYFCTTPWYLITWSIQHTKAPFKKEQR